MGKREKGVRPLPPLCTFISLMPCLLIFLCFLGELGPSGDGILMYAPLRYIFKVEGFLVMLFRRLLMTIAIFSTTTMLIMLMVAMMQMVSILRWC